MDANDIPGRELFHNILMVLHESDIPLRITTFANGGMIIVPDTRSFPLSAVERVYAYRACRQCEYKHPLRDSFMDFWDVLEINYVTGFIRCRMFESYDEHSIDRAVRVYACFLDLLWALGREDLPFPENVQSKYVRDVLSFLRGIYLMKPQRDAARRRDLAEKVWKVWFHRASRPGEGTLFKLYERTFYARAV